MGIEEDTIEDLTAIDAVDDGNVEHSFCEATAQVMYAELGKDGERDDDGESVRSGSSSSSGHGAERSRYMRLDIDRSNDYRRGGGSVGSQREVTP